MTEREHLGATLFGAGPSPDLGPRPGDHVVEIEVICTGNIARSPLGMAMLDAEARRRIGPDAPVWVRSSGIHGLAGQPAVEQSRTQALRRGLDLSAHRGSVLEPELVLRADLVLTMTESQRGKVVRRAPKVHNRVFTVLELARLCAALKPIDEAIPPRDRVHLLTRLAYGARAYVERPAGPEDIADPYGHPDEAYVRVGEQLDAAVATIAPQLFGWLPDDLR